MRLNQYIAACGVCSRREADRLIEAGEVLVDGAPARLGTSLRGDRQRPVDLQGTFRARFLSLVFPD